MEAEQEIPENGNKMKELAYQCMDDETVTTENGKSAKDLANQCMDDETVTTENGKSVKDLANQQMDNETVTTEKGNRMKDLANQGSDDETVADTVVTSKGVSSNKKAGSSSITWRSRVPQRFVQNVWNMTDDEQLDSIICWSPSGDSFIIKDQKLFEKTVLPMYFRTSNFASFNCQLNTYGFRKISLPGIWEFKNDNFRRGERGLLINIKRREHINLRNKQLAPELGHSPAGTYNLEDEFMMLTEKHAQQKLEIIKLKETQEKLKEKLAAVKMGLICSKQQMFSAAQELLEKHREASDVEVAMAVDEGEKSKESTKGKRKLQEGEISAASVPYKPAMSSDFDTWCPPNYDENEEEGHNNVFSSFDYLFGESSEWTEFYREMQEKERNVTHALQTGGYVKPEG